MKEGKLAIHHECLSVVDTKYEAMSGQSPVETIVEAISEASGTDRLDLPPLAEFVDPDAINGMFDRCNGNPTSAAIYCFQIKSWNVFVRADGYIRVYDSCQSAGMKQVFE